MSDQNSCSSLSSFDSFPALQSIVLSVCLSVSQSVCLFVCLSLSNHLNFSIFLSQHSLTVSFTSHSTYISLFSSFPSLPICLILALPSSSVSLHRYPPQTYLFLLPLLPLLVSLPVTTSFFSSSFFYLSFNL